MKKYIFLTDWFSRRGNNYSISVIQLFPLMPTKGKHHVVGSSWNSACRRLIWNVCSQGLTLSNPPSAQAIPSPATRKSDTAGWSLEIYVLNTTPSSPVDSEKYWLKSEFSLSILVVFNSGSHLISIISFKKKVLNACTQSTKTPKQSDRNAQCMRPRHQCSFKAPRELNVWCFQVVLFVWVVRHQIPRPSLKILIH